MHRTISPTVIHLFQKWADTKHPRDIWKPIWVSCCRFSFRKWLLPYMTGAPHISCKDQTGLVWLSHILWSRVSHVSQTRHLMEKIDRYQWIHLHFLLMILWRNGQGFQAFWSGKQLKVSHWACESPQLEDRHNCHFFEVVNLPKTDRARLVKEDYLVLSGSPSEDFHYAAFSLC